MFEESIFEWDSEKARLIAEKHGIDIGSVKRLFADPFRVVQYDENHSGLEDNSGRGQRDFVCGLYGAGRKNPHNYSQGSNVGREEDLLWLKQKRGLVYPLKG